jgi:hypothetical protein
MKKSKISPTEIARKIAKDLYEEMRLFEDTYPTGRITPPLVEERVFIKIREAIRKALKNASK